MVKNNVYICGVGETQLHILINIVDKINNKVGKYGNMRYRITLTENRVKLILILWAKLKDTA